MNASKTAIIVDSGCDLPNDLIDKYDIRVLRLKVMYGDKIYNDGLDLDPMEVYRRFPDEIPKTSTPNVQEVLDLVEKIRADGYENIIAITISGGLSGTYNTVAMTFGEIDDMKTYAFDTKNISIGGGIFALWAAEKLEAGMSFEDVTSGLERKIYDSKVFFYMDTLDYLRKGGRINPAVAIVGKALNLKPIISCNEKGVYYTVAKIRGSHKGLSKLMDVVTEFAGDRKCRLSVMNGDAADKAEQIKPILKEKVAEGSVVVEKQITATLAVHTGPGLIGIGVMYDD